MEEREVRMRALELAARVAEFQKFRTMRTGDLIALAKNLEAYVLHGRNEGGRS